MSLTWIDTSTEHGAPTRPALPAVEEPQRPPRAEGPPLPSAEVAVFAGVASASVAVAGCAPTGTSWFDVVLSAVAAGALVLAGSRAAPWTWAHVAGVGVLAATPLHAAASLVALLVAAHRWWRGSEPVTDERLGAGVVAVATAGLAHVSLPGPTGIESLVAAAAVAPVVVQGWVHLAHHLRRRMLQAVVVVALVWVAATLALVAAVFAARYDTEAGAIAARAGVVSIQRGDTDQALADLELARGHFDRASDTLDSWLVRPARLVPVVGQHARAMAVANRQGGDLTRAATAALVAADVEALRVGGVVDLDALAGLRAPLHRALATMEQVGVRLDGIRSPWLHPSLDRRLGELDSALDDVLAESDLARQTVEVLPDLLGVDGRRSYLVLVDPGAGSSAGGGRRPVGLAELVADRGRVAVSSRAPIGRRVGGVLVLEAPAIVALVELTAPLRVPGVEGPVDAWSVRDVLAGGDAAAAEAVVLAAFRSLGTTPLTDVGALVDAIGPAVADGHLHLATFRGPELAVLADAGSADTRSAGGG